MQLPGATLVDKEANHNPPKGCMCVAVISGHALPTQRNDFDFFAEIKAGVAKLAQAPDLKSGYSAGSSPAPGTI